MVIIPPYPPLLKGSRGDEKVRRGRRKMSEELREKILKYLDTVSQARNKEVARAIGMEKRLVDKAIGDLAKEGKIEYRSFGGITYIALPGKHQT
jgi:predicted HTH transcriptional regulator